jgi:hypothetical protein
VCARVCVFFLCLVASGCMLAPTVEHGGATT